MAPPRTINITIDGLWAVVDSRVESVLASALRGVTRSYQTDQTGRPRWRRRRVAWFRQIGEGLLIPAGLVPRAAEVLAQNGHSVRINDLRRDDVERMVAEDRLLTDVPEASQQVITAIQNNRMGQILVRDDDERALFIRLICCKYRNARVLVVVSTRQQVQSLWTKLTSGTGRDSDVPFALQFGRASSDGDTYDPRRKRLCGTFRIGCLYESQGWDFIFYAYPEQLLGMRAFEAALAAITPRVYCLPSRNLHLHPSDELLVEAVCGRKIYGVRGRGEAEVRVLIAESPCRDEVGDLPPLERKRHAFWHNERRNTFIGRIARSLAQSNIAGLWELGFWLNEDEEHLRRRLATYRTVLLAESLEHARALQSIIGSGAAEMAAEAPATYSRLVVMTMAQADALSSLDCDVLIWAGGGSWVPDLRSFPPRSRDRDHVVLIDIADDFDRQAIHETRSRLRGYSSRGWLSAAPTHWTAQQ